MKDIPTSPRIIEINRSRKARKLRLLVLFLILFIVVIVALSFFSNDRHIVINKIEVKGTHIIDQEEIKSEIEKYISGKYIYLFAKKNIVIYPHDKIYKNLLLDFPRIKELQVSRNGLNTLSINISERVGSYLYCGADVPQAEEEIGENCYFINNDGFIFDNAPYFSGNIYFKYYVPLDDGDTNPLGKQMIDVDKFHSIARFIDSVTLLGLKPTYITLNQDNINSLYLEHKIEGTTPKIIFKNDDDLNILQDNLSLAMKKKEFADEINSKYNTLLYIDLRFKNKVLYKFSE